MWITTTAGFFSAVQDREDSSVLVVRTRDRQSAQSLVDGVETLTGHEAVIVEREGTDYPYRVRVAREDYAQWLAMEVREYVTYPNFKSAVEASRGKKWSTALMEVWQAMIGVTDPWMRDHGYYGAARGRGERTFGNPHYGNYRDDDS